MSLPASVIRATAAEELLGQTLSDRFRLDSLIGHGAMGAVFKAYHLGLQKDVALKLLHPELTANDEMVARFDREAVAVSRLDHPNCVRIMDFGSTDDGRRYLVMEYLEGKDLAELVTKPMPPFRAVELTRQLLEGLAHAHAQGLVHRDIKPENIFVLGGETGEQVKLLDFGIARVTHGTGAGQLTQVGMIFGTPSYMSPEQARGEKADARSDLYSLGVVMYTMLAGEAPFEGDDPVAILRRQIAEKPPALPGSVPSPLRRFVMQLLAKKADERFADAKGALAALRRAASPTKPRLPAPGKLGARPDAPPRPKPPTLADTVAPAPKKAEDEAEDKSELPALEELIELEADDEREEDSKGPSLPPPIVSGESLGEGSDDSIAPEPEPLTASSPAPASPEAEAAPADRPAWVLPAIGVGAICLLALIIAAWPDGDDVESQPVAAAAAATASKDEDESKKEDEAPKEAEELVIVDEVPDPVPDGDGADPEAQSKRALQATLASIDALIESEKYDAAQITIGPLLEVYADEPALHWRMRRVLVGEPASRQAKCRQTSLRHRRNAAARRRTPAGARSAERPRRCALLRRSPHP